MAKQRGSWDTAFVACPIGAPDSAARARADRIGKHVLRPVLDELKLRAIRADGLPDAGTVTHHIVQAIEDAAVVIADLTDANPNVFLELGIAYTAGKPVVLLVDDAEALPFDTAGERAIVIPGSGGVIDVEVAAQARRVLRRTLKRIRSNGYVVRNVVVNAGLTRAVPPDDPDDIKIALLSQIIDRLDAGDRKATGVGGSVGVRRRSGAIDRALAAQAVARATVDYDAVLDPALALVRNHEADIVKVEQAQRALDNALRHMGTG